VERRSRKEIIGMDEGERRMEYRKKGNNVNGKGKSTIWNGWKTT
jgi:hypothetical protein